METLLDALGVGCGQSIFGSKYPLRPICRRLFKRRRVSPELLAEVQEWLFRVGWVLFFAGTTYAVVKMSVIDGWGRISSKRIQAELEKAGRGEFDYDSLEHLLIGPEFSGERED